MNKKVYDGILGLAVGDAMRVPYEFINRETAKAIVSNEMLGNRSHNQTQGTWSDDTSMTLCLLDAMGTEIDYYKIMSNFIAWYKEGKYSASGNCFDIGIGTKRAFKRFEMGISPLECGGNGFRDNGNGSLMRILPMVYYFDKLGIHQLEFQDLEIIHNVSGLTHRHPISLIACDIYVYIGCLLMEGRTISDSIKRGYKAIINLWEKQKERQWLLEYKKLEEIFEKTDEEIKSSGYVVDSLEAALWCLIKSNNYEECILKAIHLGGDTDTIAAIAGGLAGIHYGSEGIPERWIEKLQNKELILEICEKW